MDLFDKFQPLKAAYADLTAAGADPFGVAFDRIVSPTIGMIGNQEIILAGTNNYLGLTFEDEVIEAVQTGVAKYGAGTTGSRIANGTYGPHKALEDEMARHFGMSSAIVFTTGYQANLAVVAGLAGAGEQIFIDADCHASIYDACKLSGAEIVRFAHNDPASLDRRLGRTDPEASNKMVIVEGLYSMFGDVAPMAEFVEIKNKHKAYLVVDEAHSFGVFGDNGLGVAEAAGVLDGADILVGTFSKSLAGIGGFAISNHPDFELLRVAARAYMFTASSSAASVEATRAALKLIQARPELRDKLWTNARQLHAGLTAEGFSLFAEPSPVVAADMGDPVKAATFWNALLEAGIYVNLAIPPGTPNSKSLLRCSVSAAHTPDQIQRVIDGFAAVARQLGGSAAA
ncbi:MAG: serine palmitoyltransferase [Alphaproteobacteria bacterium]